MGFDEQRRALRKGTDIIVAGRLWTTSVGARRIGGVEVLILDEADRMLDMGFMPDVRRIIEQIPRKAAGNLFSATSRS